MSRAKSAVVFFGRKRIGRPIGARCGILIATAWLDAVIQQVEANGGRVIQGNHSIGPTGTGYHSGQRGEPIGSPLRVIRQQPSESRSGR